MMKNKLFVYLHPYIYFMIMQCLELKLQKSLQWVEEINNTWSGHMFRLFLSTIKFKEW